MMMIVIGLCFRNSIVLWYNTLVRSSIIFCWSVVICRRLFCLILLHNQQSFSTPIARGREAVPRLPHRAALGVSAETTGVVVQLGERVACNVAPGGCGDMSGKIVRLNRSLYGLKQSGRQWAGLLVETVVEYGMEQLSLIHI